MAAPVCMFKAAATAAGALHVPSVAMRSVIGLLRIGVVSDLRRSLQHTLAPDGRSTELFRLSATPAGVTHGRASCLGLFADHTAITIDPLKEMNRKQPRPQAKFSRKEARKAAKATAKKAQKAGEKRELSHRGSSLGAVSLLEVRSPGLNIVSSTGFSSFSVPLGSLNWCHLFHLQKGA